MKLLILAAFVLASCGPASLANQPQMDLAKTCRGSNGRFIKCPAPAPAPAPAPVPTPPPPAPAPTPPPPAPAPVLGGETPIADNFTTSSGLPRSALCPEVTAWSAAHSACSAARDSCSRTIRLSCRTSPEHRTSTSSGAIPAPTPSRRTRASGRPANRLAAMSARPGQPHRILDSRDARRGWECGEAGRDRDLLQAICGHRHSMHPTGNGLRPAAPRHSLHLRLQHENRPRRDHR
jgi:hypothetical protein